MQVVAVNLNMLQRLIQQQLFDRFTTQFRDFALQTTHARFTSVVTDNADNRAVINRQLAFLSALRSICFDSKWRLAMFSFSSSV